MCASSTDRIEKEAVLKAPQSRVWRALTNAREFGTWFGVNLEGDFAPGKRTAGKINMPGYDHITMELWIETMTPESLFSFRWHPFAIDAEKDYSGEPTTLVEFRLETVEEGTRLSIVESGFDQLPMDRRAKAFEMNSGGWKSQLVKIERHVTT